jgi:cell division septation protein DedD
MDPASVRNLERIQEKDDVSRMPRAVSITLLVLGGACIVLSAMALGGKKSGEAAPKSDPLGDLAMQKKPVAAAAKTADLAANDVTFPSILSDNAKPTTALAAVNAKPETNAAPTQPPPPTDVIPIVPLPAQNVLEASPVVTRPRDGLTKAASEAQASTETQAAPAGHDGNYQLQVSSFKTHEEADKFAQELRVRGHKAYVIQANVPSRGTWYRVRVGPFPTQAAASAYRSSFEAKEHVVPFVVPPSSQQH